MSRRKPLVALAATTAALALAVPATRADAAVTTPLFPPGSPPCQLLVNNIEFATAFGITAEANFFANVFIYAGCGGAAI